MRNDGAVDPRAIHSRSTGAEPPAIGCETGTPGVFSGFMRTHTRPARFVRALQIGLAAATVLCFTLNADVAHSQDLRATVIARQQAENANQPKGQTSSGVRTTFIRIKNFLRIPRGVHPLFGSVYSGGGLTLGAGYRRYYGDNTFFDLNGLYSFKNYKLLELSTASPVIPNRVTLQARAGWRDATQVAFYGIGPDTSVDDRTNFRLQNLYAGADAQMRPAFPLVLSAGLTYEDYSTKEGQGTYPSIETQWGPSDVPGLGADPAVVHSLLSAGIDWRPAAGYARSGGLYEVRYHNYLDPDDVYSFDRIDLELVQHIPLIREKYVISLRGRAETVLDDDTVPFFLLPSLGSGSTLRGYSSWRFRDLHSLLLQAEWRWVPNRHGLDMALFYDTGKVVNRRADLDLDGLMSNVGIGIRFHGPAATPIRVELAHGDEGFNVVFAGSAAF